MPISIPPFSRRSFLSRTTLALASLAPGAALFGAEKAVDPHACALFADTHIPADLATQEGGINMASHLRQAVAQVLAQPRVPGGAIIAGDCAFKNGQSGDYQQLAQILQPLRERGLPLHLLLGNHDHRERFLAAFPGAGTAASPVLDKHLTLLRTPRVDWYLLDSLETTDSTPGLIGPQQLAWLKTSLDAQPSKPALVVAHHNLGVDTSSNFKIDGLKDTEALLDILRPRRQVKAFIYGHTHNWHVHMDPDGLHIINLPPVAYVFRKDAPSGWVLANIAREGMRLEVRCIDPQHPSNGQSCNLKWRA